MCAPWPDEHVDHPCAHLGTVGDQPDLADGPSRRRAAALAGHRGDPVGARAGLTDTEPGVRATALAALARAGGIAVTDVCNGLVDPAHEVRRRALEVAVDADLPITELGPAVLSCLEDPDDSVVEVAAWALGELGERNPLPPTSIAVLARVATDHVDPLAREAAVAALGALADSRGLDAILAGTKDKPAVRRRAVLALAAFDGPRVDEALQRASLDRDWQVREAAELLQGEEPGSPTSPD